MSANEIWKQMDDEQRKRIIDRALARRAEREASSVTEAYAKMIARWVLDRIAKVETRTPIVQGERASQPRQESGPET
jgi:hypothetical protein